MNKLTEIMSSQPIDYEQSLREDEITSLTSSKAGVIVPFKAIPILREDRVQRGQVRVAFEMAETPQKLMNGVNVAVYAHFIPWLAFERFSGMDAFNASYAGVPQEEGGDVTPFFETTPFDNTSEIAVAMGLHHKNGAPANNQIIEAYNALVNFRRKARSKHLPERDMDDTTLARCFWHNQKMGHIVPDFDDAMIDGEVPLTVVDANMPIRGLGVNTNAASVATTSRETEQQEVVYDGFVTSSSIFTMKEDPENTGYPEVFAELKQDGIKVSLANIELAKKTAAFAKIRKRYKNVDEEYLIDGLMDGVRIPEIALSQPILLDRSRTMFGYNRRFATDSGNLDKSVTTGETFVDLTFRLPPVNTGGMILLTYEISPDQLWERQEDIMLSISDVNELPAANRDYMDPQKVDRVPNGHVDVQHTNPDGTFGYAPLNHRFKRRNINLGGKFYRPGVAEPFDEDRQRIWALEKVDPVLSEDFYLVTDLHYKVFADMYTEDPFEVMALGYCDIIGNTQFGKGLMEAGDDYEKVLAKADQTRLEGDGTEGAENP